MIVKQKQTELRLLVDKLLMHECRAPGKWSEDIRKVKQKLEQLDEERYRGALVRARAADTAAGEIPSKRALGLEKARGERNFVREIGRGGTVLTDPEGITKAFTDHYRELFALHEANSVSFQTEFLPMSPRLDDEKKESL
ncbi:hypothetical protein HPB51_011170 [Rhipicephalus microplus]|uniref:Uncharacterized protein n=1 Tax=Rhipicephalus microplus TaxID=6941 RepID=A0A9J6E0Y4_RHIMP|nr:hypothetical protein HPB51_011170 [Rhipicephalus microplus]